MELYVDGRYQSLDRPALGSRDRGFLYGEAVYEGVKITGRRPLFLESHLARLSDSAMALGLEPSWSSDRARTVLGRLLDRAGTDDAMGRLYLTRGGPGRERALPLAWVEPTPRRSNPDTPPWRVMCHSRRVVPYLPAVKHTSRLAHALARAEARAAGADDALLVHADGWVLEGTASNVFFFEADTLHTPALECGVLPGITRDVVREVAPGCEFKTVSGRYPPGVLAAADEVFLTFTSGGVRAVAAIDGTPLPAPVPGPRTRRLQAAYARRVAAALAATEPL